MDYRYATDQVRYANCAERSLGDVTRKTSSSHTQDVVNTRADLLYEGVVYTFGSVVASSRQPRGLPSTALALSACAEPQNAASE